jgi:LPXTG-motif cell wall-anchored protein
VFLVQVPPGYQANTITSVAQVMNSGYPVLHPGLVVNCPVIRTDAAVSAPGMPRTGSADGSGWLALLAAGAVLLSAGVVIRRRGATPAWVRVDR